MKQSESIAKLASAKAKAQGKFKAITKDKGATYQTRAGARMSYDYADLSSCLAAVVPALGENGIAIFQPVTVLAAGETPKVVATTLLVHRSGEWLSEEYEVPIIDVMDARSVGSASTYARRYGLLCLLGIAPSEEDDDGERARGGDYEQARAPVQRSQQQPAQRAPAQKPAPTPAPAPARAAAVEPAEDPRVTAEKAKAFASDARDVQTRREALATGIPADGYRAWAEQMIGRALPSAPAWNRSLSDDDRQVLEDEVRTRRELAGKTIPGQQAGAKGEKKRGPVQDPPPARNVTVVDEVRGTTRTITVPAQS